MPPISGLKPCANIMFDSLTSSNYDEVVCVVLTGMGADGTNGILSLGKSKPIYVIAQDEKSSVVYGMPRAIYEAGVVDEVVTLSDVAKAITKNVGVNKMDVSQYLDIFIDESSEHIQTLSDCIMTLEQEPENKDTINEIFRAAHSLKGMAGTMGFKRMQHLTHDMENVFQEVRSDKIKVDSSMIDLLFKCLDAIDSYVENIKSTSDEGTDDNEVIIKELNDFIAKANGQTVSKQAEPQEKAAEAETKDSSDASDSALDTIELTDNEKN